jgi:MFS family permease
VGPTLELYDVTIFGLASGQVFSLLFFPSGQQAVGTLLAFMTFGVGFFARPLGGIVCGHFGDRLGRRKMLQYTLILMGGATVLIGLLPTHDQIGIAAPVILVVLRFLQGFSQGGESGGGTLTLLEHARPDRRGIYTAIGGASAPLGAVLATLVWAAAKSVGSNDFVSWGWRIPFVASVLVIAVGVYARIGLAETPAFTELTDTNRTARAPIFEVLRQDWRRTLCVVGINFGFTNFWYLVITWAPSYLSSSLKIPGDVTFTGMLVSSLVQAGAVIFFGALSDRHGRKPIIMAGTLFTAAQAVPFFLLLQTRSAGLILVALTIAAIGMGAVLGPLLAFFCEQYPARRRYSGFSIGYQLGAALGGGLAPAMATALHTGFGGSTGPVAGYIVLASLVTVGCLLPLKETAGARSRGGDS